MTELEDAAFDAAPDALGAGFSGFVGMALDAEDSGPRAFDTEELDFAFCAGAVLAAFGAFAEAGAVGAFAAGLPGAVLDAAAFGLAVVTAFAVTGVLAAAFDGFPAGATFAAGFSVLDFAILSLPVRGDRAAPRSCGAVRRRTGLRFPFWCEAV